MLSLVSRGKLTTLLFHKVPASRHPLVPQEPALPDFSAVLDATLRRFRILPLEDAVTALRAGNLPPNAACLTFDDGYPEWRTGVLPVLESKGVHATFFVTTGQYAGLPMWNERILHAVEGAAAGTPPLQWSGLPTLRFDGDEGRRRSIEQLDAFLKYQLPADKEQLLQQLERHTGLVRERVPTMSVDDLRHIHARGFGIGGHSVTHPILSRCTPAQAYNEIAGAREQLEALIRGKVAAFAYPNGTPGKDFGPEHIEMVRRAGYRYAVTTQRGFASSDTSLMQIPRFTPWGPTAGRMDVQFLRNLLKQGTLLPEDGAAGKRALMVAFHFPPQAGSSGMLRTLNFAKYLPALGWDCSVLAAKPKAFEQQRNDLVGSIPARTRVVRAAALDAARHLAWRGKYPRLFALPDRWSTWALPAVWAGLREVRRTQPHLIWSTYPIATAHLIGGALSRLTGLPWVADFRDPMINRDYPSDRLQRRVWQWLEARVLRSAAACVFTTEAAAQTYASRYPMQAGKCHVIENGYDEEAFSSVQACREGVPEGKLLWLHSGLIYPRDRDPSTFFAAVRSLIDDGTLRQQDLCIRFRAPQHEQEVLECARQQGLTDCVEVAPPIPYQRAIAEMMGADLLLVFQGRHFNTQIPAKIYEYLRAGRDILSIVDPSGGTAAQMRQFKANWIVDIASVNEVREGLLGVMRGRADSDRVAQLAENQQSVLVYSRQAQTHRLRALFDAVSDKSHTLT